MIPETDDAFVVFLMSLILLASAAMDESIVPVDEEEDDDDDGIEEDVNAVDSEDAFGVCLISPLTRRAAESSRTACFVGISMSYVTLPGKMRCLTTMLTELESKSISFIRISRLVVSRSKRRVSAVRNVGQGEEGFCLLLLLDL